MSLCRVKDDNEKLQTEQDNGQVHYPPIITETWQRCEIINKCVNIWFVSRSLTDGDTDKTTKRFKVLRRPYYLGGPIIVT